ncbi:MAG: nitroreductase family protein, partial [Hyphomicrobiaceae bacterium]|nr:nitroreductase family protein [Hyphomicrobiaceae bacterium]
MTSPPPILSLDDAIRWRRDVRRFRRDPVPAALLAEVLALAEHAPSVGNSQPWRITAVDSQSARDRVGALFEIANAAAAQSYPPGRREHYQLLKLAGFDAAPIHLAVTCAEATSQGSG